MLSAGDSRDFSALSKGHRNAPNNEKGDIVIMAEKNTAKSLSPQLKKWLPVGVVVLLAVIFVLAQHIILTNRGTREAEEAYQKALNESGAQTQVVEVEPAFKVNSTTLREVIAPASKLIAYEYFYTDADKYEKSQPLFNTSIKLPFTTNQTVFTYSGTISAGIELGKVVFDVDNDAKTIRVLLPEPEILAHQLDMESLQFYDIKKSVFTRVDLGDYAEMQSALMEKQETKLMQNDTFWKNMKENTRNLLNGLITASGKIDEYTITYEWLVD